MRGQFLFLTSPLCAAHTTPLKHRHYLCFYTVFSLFSLWAYCAFAPFLRNGVRSMVFNPIWAGVPGIKWIARLPAYLYAKFFVIHVFTSQKIAIFRSSSKFLNFQNVFGRSLFQEYSRSRRKWFLWKKYHWGAYKKLSEII